MPTEKPRVTFTISKERLSDVEDYRFENKLKNQTQAILSLLEKGLSGIEKEKALPLSDKAQKVAEQYLELDSHGQNAVDAILDIEYQRVKAANAVQQADKVEIASEIAPEPVKIIPLFVSASAAGIASPILGEDYEDYTLQKGDPQRAIMAIRVQGDSMEPYFPDGSIVFCDKTPMQVGDIGVFILDGGSLLKQWCPDNYGNAYLFSLNRKRADADVTVWSTSNQNLTCMGRVITNKRFPLP